MIVRFYAVDAPESGQEGSKEATEFVKNRLLKRMDNKKSSAASSAASSLSQKGRIGKVVTIKLLRIDQYNRAVAQITSRYTFKSRYLPFLFRKDDIAYDLAKAGHATLYVGGGKEYNGRKAEFVGVIRRALLRKKRMGLVDHDALSPAEYKRMKKEGRRRRMKPI